MPTSLETILSFNPQTIFSISRQSLKIVSIFTRLFEMFSKMSLFVKSHMEINYTKYNVYSLFLSVGLMSVFSSAYWPHGPQWSSFDKSIL